MTKNVDKVLIFFSDKGLNFVDGYSLVANKSFFLQLQKLD